MKKVLNTNNISTLTELETMCMRSVYPFMFEDFENEAFHDLINDVVHIDIKQPAKMENIISEEVMSKTTKLIGILKNVLDNSQTFTTSK